MSNYQEDREWSDTYDPQIKEILRFNAHHILDIDIASFEKDTTNSTDYIIRFKGGDIAVRIRRPDCKYRDLTIRALRNSGAETELSKIKKGFAKLYLYGWINKQNKISNWILVDLDKVREQKLWEDPKSPGQDRPLIPNNDGTYFIAIPAQEIEDKKALIAGVF